MVTFTCLEAWSTIEDDLNYPEDKFYLSHDGHSNLYQFGIQSIQHHVFVYLLGLPDCTEHGSHLE